MIGSLPLLLLLPLLGKGASLLATGGSVLTGSVALAVAAPLSVGSWTTASLGLRASVEAEVAAADGDAVGAAVGAEEGDAEGPLDGEAVGVGVGLGVGAEVVAGAAADGRAWDAVCVVAAGSGSPPAAGEADTEASVVAEASVVEPAAAAAPTVAGSEGAGDGAAVTALVGAFDGGGVEGARVGDLDGICG